MLDLGAIRVIIQRVRDGQGCSQALVKTAMTQLNMVEEKSDTKRIKCPFIQWGEIVREKCPYINDDGKCDIHINAGDSDSFCGGAVEGKVELLEDD